MEIVRWKLKIEKNLEMKIKNENLKLKLKIKNENRKLKNERNWNISRIDNWKLQSWKIEKMKN